MSFLLTFFIIKSPEMKWMKFFSEFVDFLSLVLLQIGEFMSFGLFSYIRI